MNRKGYVTAALFCILSFGGILALVEQSRGKGDAARRIRSMNISSQEIRAFGSALRAAIERGAQLDGKGETDDDDRPAPPKRLFLR